VRNRERARAAFQRGVRLAETAPEEAADAYEAAVAADDEYLRAWLALARARDELGRATPAVEAWRRCVALAPDDGDALLGLGEALRQVNCYVEALRAYDLVMAVADGNVYALAGRAECLRMLGRPMESLPWFERSLAFDPAHLFAIRGRAAALNALCRYDEATEAWQRALEIDPDSGFAREGLAEAQRGARSHATLGAVDDDPPQIPARDSDREAAETARDWATALGADGRPEQALEAARRAVDLAPNWVDASVSWAAACEAADRWPEAAVAWARAAEFRPDDAGVAAGVARSTERTSPGDALAAWARAARLAPRDAAVQVAHAEALLRDARLDEAAEAARAATAAAPDSPIAWSVAARVADARGDEAEAARAWERAERFGHPAATGRARTPKGSRSAAARSRARAAIDAATALDAAHRHQEAIVDWRRATDEDPTSADAWTGLGLALLEDRQPEAAASALQRALDLAPDRDDVALAHADALRRAGRLHEALTAYARLTGKEDADARARVGHGETLRLLGRADEALVRFDAVLRIDPRAPSAATGRAAALNKLRRYEEAREAWALARELLPDSAFVQRGSAACNAALAARARVRPEGAMAELERGRALHRERDLAGAAAAFERALALDATLLEAGLRLGLVLEDERRWDQAIAAYERVLGVEPRHVQAATNIAEALRKSEQYAEAIAAYDRALSIDDAYLYALAGRAECMRMLGDYETSLPWFDRALAVGPRHAFAVQGKAAALNALGRYADAMPLWDAALQIEPSSVFATEGRAWCEAQLAATPAEVAATESRTPVLDEQGRDLTALARQGRLPTVVGREAEVRAVLKTLVRRLKANPLLLGEPGVGKTAIVEAVAQRLASDDAPARLRHVRLIELAVGSLVAGTKYRGTFEERLRDLLKEVRENPGILLFVDEIHTLVGAGRTEGGSLDAANILKPALARGEIQLIGATTMAEYRKHFESDGALDRRFQPITVEEPSPEAATKLLEAVCRDYEQHHAVRIDPTTAAACVRLAVRYLPERRLPDKALDRLDDACADASLDGVDLVTPAIVARVVAERTGVPAAELTTSDRRRVLAIEVALGKRVVGQPEAVKRLATAVRTARADLRARERPRGVFLFSGPSGVGKTELARALADALFPEGDALTRVDMAEFGERFTTTRLLGAPPGYAGHGEEGQLTGALRRRPYAVVLLDEFDKAHPDVQSTFMTLFDEGSVTDSDGRRVSAREAWFVLTTNAGSEAGVARGRMGFGGDTAEGRRELALDRVRKTFRPELLQRIDETVVFDALGDDALQAVVVHHLGRLRERAAEQGLALSWDPAVPAFCARIGAEPSGGARGALRALEAQVAAPLADRLLAGGARALRASVRDERVALDPVVRGQREAQEPV
jgi:ATP-dependent Clp protease ATP-binding subunit ClpC